jgi:hypothetical protein
MLKITYTDAYLLKLGLTTHQPPTVLISNPNANDIPELSPHEFKWQYAHLLLRLLLRTIQLRQFIHPAFHCLIPSLH